MGIFSILAEIEPYQEERKYVEHLENALKELRNTERELREASTECMVAIDDFDRRYGIALAATRGFRIGSMVNIDSAGTRDSAHFGVIMSISYSSKFEDFRILVRVESPQYFITPDGEETILTYAFTKSDWHRISPISIRGNNLLISEV